MLQLDDFNFTKTEVSVERIKKYNSNDSFMSLAVDLFKEIITITVVVSCVYRLDENNKPRKWTRNEAILGGLMVRLSKLQSSFLDQICQKRMEIAMILLRCLGEGLININYLLERNNDELSNKFIEYSLREEKRLLNRINNNIAERGYELPIEQRMKKSIKRAFKTSNFVPAKVNENNFDSWEKTIHKRAKIVGMEDIYSALFSLPSHDIHGNWQNLINNHLEYENNEFNPNTNRKMPKPQPLFGICVLSAKTVKLYIKKIVPDCSDKEKVLKMLEDVTLRVRVADELHEHYLQKKQPMAETG